MGNSIKSPNAVNEPIIVGWLNIEKSGLLPSVSIFSKPIENQTYTKVPGAIPKKVPKKYSFNLMLKNAGITFTAQKGTRGINLKEMR